MVYPKTIEAVGVVDAYDYLHPKKFEYTPREFRDIDIDIKVECCGVCGSDIHTVSSNWSEDKVETPIAVGHEIVGTVVRIGSKAKAGLKLGDRVGVGAQCDCDSSCVACKSKLENHCLHNVGTYGSKIPGSAEITMGGDASHVRVNSQFVFKIPDGIESIYAAPLLCGGITGFGPLIQHKITSKHKVGVVGIGGIGHMTILFAKALGCEVTAISRGMSKKSDAEKLGATHYIATSDPESIKARANTLDIIVNTGSSFTGSHFESLFSLLKPRGTLAFITYPPATEKLTISPSVLIHGGYKLQGSLIGSPEEIEYMLEFAAKHNIKPWVETIDINEESLGKAWERMEKGDVKYRFTMTGYDKFFKSSQE